MTRFPVLTAAEHRLKMCNEWTEQQLQDKTLQLADELGWTSYHTHDSRRSRKGWPDLYLMHEQHKRLLVWELKSANGKLTVEQRMYIRVFAALGVTVEVLRPADWASGYIQGQLASRSHSTTEGTPPE